MFQIEERDKGGILINVAQKSKRTLEQSSPHCAKVSWKKLNTSEIQVKCKTTANESAANLKLRQNANDKCFEGVKGQRWICIS